MKPHMKPHVYKVVSGTQSDLTYNSFNIFAHSGCQLKYKLNEETKPKHGLIFVFKDLKHVEHFWNTTFCDNQTNKLLKCKYTGDPIPLPMRYRNYFDDEHFPNHFKQLWENKDKTFDIPNYPGTYGVESVTPIEIIDELPTR